MLHGRTIPHPVEEAIETLVEEEYEVAENTPIRISNEHATYLNLSTGDGGYISTRTDGAFSAKWIPAHRENEVTRSPEGHVQDQWKLMTESAFFPIEVKSGKVRRVRTRSEGNLGSRSECKHARTSPGSPSEY